MADTVTYIYDEKSQGPRDGVDVFKVVGGVETKIFDGEWADGSTGYDALKREAINALKATHPDIASMTLRPKPPAPPPTPAPPTPPIVPVPIVPPPPPLGPPTRGVYYPKSKYSKPKSAGPGEFVEKKTRKEYKGTFVKTFDKKYFAGSTPMSPGIELEKVKDHQLGLDEGLPFLFGILAGSLGGFFKKKPTRSEKESGVTKRYFVQDLNNSKIVETDKPTYNQTKLTVPNRRFTEVDWIIKGPAEDIMVNGYPFEGAESKNRKAIQALEKTMPGITAFIKDYKYLVEEPLPIEVQALQAPPQSLRVLDANTQLENSRKANFDLRK